MLFPGATMHSWILDNAHLALQRFHADAALQMAIIKAPCLIHRRKLHFAADHFYSCKCFRLSDCVRKQSVGRWNMTDVKNTFCAFLVLELDQLGKCWRCLYCRISAMRAAFDRESTTSFLEPMNVFRKLIGTCVFHKNNIEKR